MKEKYKLGVIVPTYNAESFLNETMQSILKQTMTDFFVVFVNDGSTDNTLDILNKYHAQDDRIVILSQANSGPGDARNKGLEYAYQFATEYTLILDADDIYHPTMFADLINQADKTKADIAICRARKYDNSNKKYFEMSYSLKTEMLPKHKAVFSYQDVKDCVFSFCVGWAWDKLYRTEFIKSTALKFQNLKSTNDAYFVFCSLVKAKSITIVDKVLVSHRINVATSVSNNREKDITCFYDAISAIKNELLAMGIYEVVERGFLNWALHFSIWQFSTINHKQKKALFNYLKKECFVELGLANYPKTFFEVRDYDEYQKIMNHSFKEYLDKSKNNIFTKIYKSLKYDGLKSTIKKISNKIKTWL